MQIKTAVTFFSVNSPKSHFDLPHRHCFPKYLYVLCYT